MSRSLRLRAHRAVALVAVVVAGLAGCGGDDGGDANAESDEECRGGGLFDEDSLDSVVDVAGSVGGETVEDTEIHFTEGEGVVPIGGLDVPMPVLEELDYYDTSDSNITVPPSWGTLDTAQLNSHADPFGNPTIGMAVFAQTTMVTQDACRQEVLDAYWLMARFVEADVIHASSTTASDSGVTCWTEVRHGRTRPGFDPNHRAVVLFGGPGFASSGIILSAPPSFMHIPDIAGDLVEAVCGTRPDGL